MIYLRCAERLAVLSGFCGATAGRITAGTRYAGSSTTGSASFTERGISYDKAGGMLAIQRYGSNASTPEDNLTLTYNGMTLASVTGTIGGQSVNATFTYDACGRTLTDGVSKLNYQYNLLGALTAVADAGTLTPTTLSTYRHLADGTKYMTVSAGNNGALLYRGPLTFTIADVTATTPAISFLRAETGSTGAAIIASATGSVAAPYFYVTDQLGSVRAVVDSQGSVVERNDYYTYGKRHTTGRTYADLKNSPLLFSGKEDQGQALDIASGATTPSDLRILDFGARHYDPIVPRWTTMDPLAEKYYSISPYAYCAGDPVNLTDPTGMDWYTNNDTGYYTWFEGNEDREGYTYYGEKGVLLGEGEDMINKMLQEAKIADNLYTDGFTLSIRDTNVEALRGGTNNKGLFSEFLNNDGPEYSIFLEGHPYVEEIKNTEFIKNCQNRIIHSKRGFLIESRSWTLFDVLKTKNMSEQFIGSFSYYGKINKDKTELKNLIYDAKSRTSLFYHFGFINKERKDSKNIGNTYQFYYWITKL